MQGRKAFEEKLFTNFQLSDRVPSDNFYRRLKETLDLQFLRKTTAPYYGTEGHESIDPIVFFNGYSMKEYRSSRIDCGPCPLRESCIGKSFEKRIRETLDKPYYDKMHERLKTSYARKMKKLRQSTVEPVLGTLINFLAMKRVNTRGIKLANKCMLMAAIAYNLKKMMKFKSTSPMAAMAHMDKELDNFLIFLFSQLQFLSVAQPQIKK